MQEEFRRNDYDVTNSIQVSSTDAVCEAVIADFAACWPDSPEFPELRNAFTYFHQMYAGELPGFVGCETVYHDRQHSLDVTLALSRLIIGHEKTAAPNEKLGRDLARVGIVMGLLHDAGYIRRTAIDEGHGAEYTQSHVARSGQLLVDYLPKLGLGEYGELAQKLVWYTHPAQVIAEVGITDPKHHLLGQLLGTADYMAQMSDRCYLEKARDRLYAEFVLGGLAVSTDENGQANVQYESGDALLRKTAEFADDVMKKRLNGDFEKVYHYFEAWSGGGNPYLEAIEKNVEFLRAYLRKNQLPELKRNPPCFTLDQEGLNDTQSLVAEKIREYITAESK